MTSPNRIAEVAAAMGDPARAAMLTALIDGRALTAAELAHAAGVTPQTASTHLRRLLDVDLLALERQGRHRYHRLAGPEVARLLEGLMQHAARSEARRPLRSGPRDEALCRARTCYDHLAGRLGVAIADAAVARRYVELDGESALVTNAGTRAFILAGILPANPSPRPTRPVCRPCLDWSERRPHLAGQLGAAICHHGFSHGWFRRLGPTRALAVTQPGQRALADLLGVRLA